MMMMMVMIFFCVQAPCGQVARSQCFGDASYVHLQGLSNDAGTQRDYKSSQEGKSDGKGQTGWSEVQTEQGQ
jgi:hypothetical protein